MASGIVAEVYSQAHQPLRQAIPVAVYNAITGEEQQSPLLGEDGVPVTFGARIGAQLLKLIRRPSPYQQAAESAPSCISASAYLWMDPPALIATAPPGN